VAQRNAAIAQKTAVGHGKLSAEKPFFATHAIALGFVEPADEAGCGVSSRAFE